MSDQHDALDHFILCAEHLEVARELLTSGSPAKERMAVILLDGLTDAFLYRRLSTLYRFIEEGWWYRARMPSYPKSLRDRATAEFHTRLKLARPKTYYDEYVFDDTPFIGDTDVTVLQIGHAYRNDAYHRDRHNPDVIGVIGRLMLGAASRLFARAQPGNIGIGVTPHDAARLDAHGLEAEDGFFSLRRGAEALGNRLIQGLDITVAALADQLANDLEYRLDEVEDSFSYLRASGVDWANLLAMHELAYKHGNDETFLELSEQMDPEIRAERAGLNDVPEQFRAEAKAAPRLYFERQAELLAAMRRQVTTDTLADLRAKAGALRHFTRKPKVLSRYHEADRVLVMVEECSSNAIRGLDEMSEREVDRARGN
jgi:hypothetical protein